jgi:hypothetical protein
MRPFSALFIASLAVALGAGAWLAGSLRLYSPGSDLGFALGVTGTLMMATLLLYPLRKRLRLLRSAGDLRHWFRVHMFLGVTGPVLVMYHSTLRASSLNAAVALYSMLLVAASGIVGRFIYTRIHHGLYGRRATLQEREQALVLAASALAAAPAGGPERKRLLAAQRKAQRDVAQFRFYERLFSLWHVLHVPLVYMLVLCAAFHVLAVYMY